MAAKREVISIYAPKPLTAKVVRKAKRDPKMNRDGDPNLSSVTRELWRRYLESQ